MELLFLVICGLIAAKIGVGNFFAILIWIFFGLLALAWGFKTSLGRNSDMAAAGLLALAWGFKTSPILGWVIVAFLAFVALIFYTALTQKKPPGQG